MKTNTNKKVKREETFIEQLIGTLEKKSSLYTALEDALENTTSAIPEFCNTGYCYRKVGHKGIHILSTENSKF